MIVHGETFRNYFIKNPQTTIALPFLTHNISATGCVLGEGGLEGFRSDVSFRGYQAKGDEKRHGEGGGDQKMGQHCLWMAPNMIIYFQRTNKMRIRLLMISHALL